MRVITPAGSSDTNTPETQYGPETTNTGDGNVDYDAIYEELNAPKPKP